MKYNYFKSCLVLSLLSFLIGCSVNESNLKLNSDTSALSPKEHKEVLNSLQGKILTIQSENNSDQDSGDSDATGLLMPESQISFLNSNSICEQKDTIDVLSESISVEISRSFNDEFRFDNNEYLVCSYKNSNEDYTKDFYYDDQSQLIFTEESKESPVSGSNYQNHELFQSLIKDSHGDILYSNSSESYEESNVYYSKYSSQTETYQAESSILFYIKNSLDFILEFDFVNLYYPNKSSWDSMISFDKQSLVLNSEYNNDDLLNFSIIVKTDDYEYMYYSYSFNSDNDDEIYIFTSTENRSAGVNPVGKLVVNEDLSMDIYYLDETGNYNSVSQ